MKRVKIMLTAIGVFAIVGGALAFKAKTFGNDDYCTKSNNGNGVCTSFILNASFQAGGTSALMKYRFTTNTINCTLGSVTCPSTGRVIQ